MAFLSTTTSWLRLASAVQIPFEERIDFFDRLLSFKRFSQALGFSEAELARDPNLSHTVTSVFFCWTKHRDFDRALDLAFERTHEPKLSEHIARFVAKKF